MGIRKGAGVLRLPVLMLFLVEVAALTKPSLIAYRTVSVEFPVDLHRLADDSLHLLCVFRPQLVRIAVCRVCVPRSETLEDSVLRRLRLRLRLRLCVDCPRISCVTVPRSVRGQSVGRIEKWVSRYLPQGRIRSWPSRRGNHPSRCAPAWSLRRTRRSATRSHRRTGSRGTSAQS